MVAPGHPPSRVVAGGLLEVGGVEVVDVVVGVGPSRVVGGVVSFRAAVVVVVDAEGVEVVFAG